MGSPAHDPRVAPTTRVARLVDYLWKNQRKAFVLGRHDCALFAARWVDSELGTAYESDVRQLARRVGLAKLRDELRHEGAYERLIIEVAKSFPARSGAWAAGDLAVFKQDDGAETLGVLSARLVHAPAPDSLLSFDARHVVCHWGLECLRR